MTQGKIKVFGGGQFRPLLHVRDAAQAMVENLTTRHTGIFNLHSQNVKIIDLARKVIKRVPGAKLDTISDMKFEDVRNYRVTSLKARKTFGFKPKLRVEDGIGEIKQLMAEKRIKDLNHPKYTNEGYLTMFNTHVKK